MSVTALKNVAACVIKEATNKTSRTTRDLVSMPYCTGVFVRRNTFHYTGTSPLSTKYGFSTFNPVRLLQYIIRTGSYQLSASPFTSPLSFCPHCTFGISVMARYTHRYIDTSTIQIGVRIRKRCIFIGKSLESLKC